MSNFIYCCVDEDSFSHAVCDYGVFISNTSNIPLKFLNIVEHTHNSKELDLSGNIALGARDDLLEKLADEEEIESKNSIQNGKRLLKELEQRAKENSKNSISISQIHGEVIESLIELKDDIKLLILGISSSENKIGENIKEIIREINRPSLLINSEFKTPKKIMIAYNGSNESKEILKIVATNPLFGDIQRCIVNIDNNIEKSQKLLQEAKEIFLKMEIEVEIKSLQGDPKEQIINYFNENNFDILVMGAYSHSRIKEFVFGSFTSYTLENIKKPILLFR